MHKRTIFIILLILGQTAGAAEKTYQTEPNTAASPTQNNVVSPLISVDPDDGKTRVFIDPRELFSNNLAQHDTPVYHARTLYQPTQAGISTSITKLHQHMADTCPQGWLKRQEWTNLKTNTPELHYQFQCIGAPE